MKNLVLLKARCKLSKLFAIAMLININVGCVSIFASESQDNFLQDQELELGNDVSVTKYLKPSQQNIVQSSQAPVAKPVATAKPTAIPVQAAALRPDDIKALHQYQIDKIDFQTADLSSKIERLERLIGKKTSFPTDCSDDKATKNAMEFLREILERVCGINCGSEEEMMNVLLEKFEVIGSKESFPKECSYNSTAPKNVVEFLREILRRVCLLDCPECATQEQVRDIVSLKFEELIGAKESFPTECKESKPQYDKPCKLDCKQDKPCREKGCKFDAEFELNDSDFAHDRGSKQTEKLESQKYNVTQFLKEILRRVCLINPTAENAGGDFSCENSERLKDCLLQAIEHADEELLKKIGKSLPFPADCTLSDGTDNGKSKSLFEFSREILQRICQLEESSSSLECIGLQNAINSKIDYVVGHKAAFPEECDGKNKAQKTLFDFLKEILRRLCILESEVSSGSCSNDSFATSNDCCVTIFTKLDECCESLNRKADVLQSSLNGCCSTLNSKVDEVDSSLGEVYRMVKKQNEKQTHMSDKVDFSTADMSSKIERLERLIGKKTNFPTDCSDDKAAKNAMEFLREILERVCGINCASEEEMMNVLLEKFELIGSKESFSKECSYNPAAPKNVVEFLREILKRVCLLDSTECATQEQVRDIVSGLIGAKESFPPECKESKSQYYKPCKLDCMQDKPCREKGCKFDAEFELNDSDSAHDNRGPKQTEKLESQKYNVTQFLKEILRRICLIDTACEQSVREISCENSERLKDCLLQAIALTDEEMSRKLGKSLPFPDCTSSDGANKGKPKSLFEFSREILQRICQLEESSSLLECVNEAELQDAINSKFDYVVGHKAAFPEECDGKNDNAQRTLFDFSKEILRRLCILESEVACSSSSNDVFATSNDCYVTIFTKLDECCELLNSKADVLQGSLNGCCSTLNSKVDEVDSSLGEIIRTVKKQNDKLQIHMSDKVDFSTADLRREIEKLESLIGKKTTFSADCSDDKATKNAMEFLREILERVCGINCASEEEMMNFLLEKFDVIGFKEPFPKECSVCPTPPKNVVEFLREILKRVCLLDIPECATQEQVRDVVSSKFEELKELIGGKETFPSECKESKPQYYKPCKLDCKQDKPCREKGCKFDAEFELNDVEFELNDGEFAELNDSDFAHDNRGQKYNEKLVLPKHNVTQFLKEILRRVCLINPTPQNAGSDITCQNSERLKDCLLQAIEHADEELLRKIGKSLPFPADCTLSDGIDNGNPKSLFEFSREILQRICQLEESSSSLECINEAELQDAINSKFDHVVGHKASFPEECDGSVDNDQKTLFDFSKEILRRLCILESEVSSSSSSSSSLGDSFATCNDCFVTIFTKLDECCESLNSKVDVVDSSLDACCFTLNSKVDVIISEVDECCFTLNSKLDLVDSSLDECCFTLNSKSDVLQSDLDECCFTLNSKVDLVDSSLDECCFTLNSKSDVLQSDLDECCFTLNSKADVVISEVEECCFTLNSKADVLQIDLDECCMTANSKLDVITSDLVITNNTLGLPTDVVLESTLPTSTAGLTYSNYDVMQWLKAIYYRLGQQASY